MNFNSFKYQLYFFREKAMTLQSEIYSGMIKDPAFHLNTVRYVPVRTGAVRSKIKYKRFYLEKKHIQPISVTIR